MPVPSKLPAAGKWRYAVGCSGFLILAVGVTRTALGADGASLIAVIIAGAVLLLSPLIIDRLQNLSIGPDGVALGLFGEVAHLAPRTAEILGHTDLVGIADTYGILHQELRHHRDARIMVQDLLLSRAAALAQRQKFDKGEVQELFANGAPAVRMLALGLMAGDASLADPATITSAIAESASNNEQYHGLILAEQNWDRMTASQQNQISVAIRDVRLPPASGRAKIAGRLRNTAAAVPPGNSKG